jgi:hypothetical protein
LVVGTSFLQTFAPQAHWSQRLQVPGVAALLAIGLVLYVVFRRLEDRAGAR